MKKHLILYSLLIFGLQLLAQETQDSLSIKATYGIDSELKIMVWPSDSLYEFVKIGLAKKSLRLPEDLAGYLTSKEIRVAEGNDSMSLYFTSLPVLKISSGDSIPNEPKVVAEFAYMKDTIFYSEMIGIELRGNSALRYPKKSFDIEIWSDTVTKASKDLRLGDLRVDDDWILNSIYNEPLKFRSHFSNKLWLELSRSRVDDSTHREQAGIDTKYVEVFLNDRYQGVYLLSEQIDRKLLKLKKIKNDTVHGELFKAGSYDIGTAFQGAKPFNNAFPYWIGFEMEYPYENFEAHWDNLYEFIDLVANADEKTFAEAIDKSLDLNNAIDYYILMNVLRATDNMRKNYFLARHDIDSPYYFVPWDLDGVMGCIIDGKRILTTNDIMSNGLFDRLMAENPANYRERMKARWTALRSNELELNKLTGAIQVLYTRLKSENLYKRNQLVWPVTISESDHLAYLLGWLEQRIEFLDGFFKSI